MHRRIHAVAPAGAAVPVPADVWPPPPRARSRQPGPFPGLRSLRRQPGPSRRPAHWAKPRWGPAPARRAGLGMCRSAPPRWLLPPPRRRRGTAAVVELAAIAAATTGCATRNATMLAGVRLARAASGLVTNNSRGRGVLLRCQPDNGLSGAPPDASRSTTGHRCQLGDWTAHRRGRGGHSTEPTTAQ